MVDLLNSRSLGVSRLNKQSLLSFYTLHDWFRPDCRSYTELNITDDLFEEPKLIVIDEEERDALPYSDDRYRKSLCDISAGQGIYLEIKKGKRVYQSCFWVGYFEDLIDVEILIEDSLGNLYPYNS